MPAGLKCDCVCVCSPLLVCRPNCVSVWKMADQTERVMTTDTLSIFPSDRIRGKRRGGEAGQIGHGVGNLICT